MYRPGWSKSPPEDSVGKTLVVELKYGLNGAQLPASVGCQAWSPAGLFQAQEMPRVLGGLGIAIISTSHGCSPTVRPRQAKRRPGKSSPGSGSGD